MIKMPEKVLKIKEILLSAVDIFLPSNTFDGNFFYIRLKMRTAVFNAYFIMLTACFFFYQYLQYFNRINRSSFLLLIIFLMQCISLVVMRSRGNHYFSFKLILFGSIFMNLVLIYNHGGIIYTGIFWNFIITILSIFLLGPLNGTLITTFSTGCISFLYWLGSAGYEFPQYGTWMDSNKTALYFGSIVILPLLMITWLYEASISNAWKIEHQKNIKLFHEYKLRAAMEKDLEVKNRELFLLNKNLEQRVEDETNKRLEKEQIMMHQSKLAAVGEMISAIAHQWRQPLNSLALIVQDISEAYSAGEWNEQYMKTAVEESMSQIFQMTQTINDFRDFMIPSKSRIDFDLCKAIEDTIKISTPMVRSHSIQITFEVKKDQDFNPASVSGIPSEFKQVILNLINNAKDSIEERKKLDPAINGEITIDLYISSLFVIHIRDNGIGISDDAIGKIFQPYYTSKGGKGTGIGLYMSRKIIEEQMNGCIFACNNSKGACFTIIMDTEIAHTAEVFSDGGVNAFN